MGSVFLLFSAVFAFLAVALGAFGAHGLKEVLSADMMAVYKTAVHYQIWHSLGLGLISVLKPQQQDVHLLIWSGWLMVVGVVLFSGSLYLLALTEIKALGMITPFGGLCFLAAWACLIVVARRGMQS